MSIVKEKLDTSSTFADNLSLPVHRWYRFPAGFSAEWVRSLIVEEKKIRNEIVLLDPFAGVGTSVLAGEEALVESYGLEAQPFIARIAKAKLLWNSSVNAFSEFANEILQKAKSEDSYTPEYPKLIKKCYPDHILRDLHSLKWAWNQQNDGSHASELTWLALTSILRSCSPVGTAPWQYVLPRKSKNNIMSPFLSFANQIQKMASDMRFLQGQGINPTGKVLYCDARNCKEIKDDSITLVITSPPYANNYDYADATRLEMTFWGDVDGWGDLHRKARQGLVRSCSQHASIENLNLTQTLDTLSSTPIFKEIQDVCHQLEIERLGHGGRKEYHLMIAAYFSDMLQIWYELRRVCRRDANICYVVGDSAPYGIYVPVDKWLGELAVFAGFRTYHFEKTRDRNTKWKNRKHRVPLHEGRLWVRG
jgi:hypothetical protein